MNIDIKGLRKDKRPQSSAVVHALLDRLEASEKENAKLREALVEKVVSETMLRDLSIRGGSIHASFEGGAMHLLVDAFVEQFVESGATNYLEMQFHSNVTGPLVVTLQRVNGKTAHQLRAEAEKERDALRVDKATLQQMLYSIKNHLEAAEKSDAESIAMYRKARDERDELRAKVEAMERQEPYAFAVNFPESSRVELVHDLDEAYEDMTYEAYEVRKLYLAPGAKGEEK